MFFETTYSDIRSFNPPVIFMRLLPGNFDISTVETRDRLQVVINPQREGLATFQRKIFNGVDSLLTS